MPVPVPKFAVVKVTAKQAEEWLGKNTHNRNLRDRSVAGWAEDMKAGRWLMTGEPIKFDENGVLIDGQHRLHAIIKASDGDSEFGVTMVVVTNLAAESQNVMDSGTKRKASDSLHLDGVRNASIVASASRLLVQFDNKQVTNNPLTTTPQIREWLDLNEGFEEFIAYRISRARSVPLAPAPFMAAMWLFSRKDSEDATNFFEGLVTLAGMETGDPRLALFRKFSDIRTRREYLWATDALGMLIVTWNHYRAGRTVSRILRPSTPWTSKTFPVVK